MAVTERDVVEAIRDLGRRGETVEVLGTGSVVRQLAAPAHASELAVGGLRGIVKHDPADLTVTAGAGTKVTDLNEELAGSGQECPIDGVGTSIGGRIATGLSGIRRLGVGHVRDWVLGARVVSAEGGAFRIGSATMKNVTGYDLPRLFCGSWGTLGILTEVTLRVRPIPEASDWWVGDPRAVPGPRVPGAAAVIRRPEKVHVFLEGHPADCAALAHALGLSRGEAPEVPSGVRVSVPPDLVGDVARTLVGEYAAEVGVGVIHLDGADAGSVLELRAQAEAVGGRLLVLDPSVRDTTGATAFGSGFQGLHSLRVKDALDPSSRLAPWRFLS